MAVRLAVIFAHLAWVVAPPDTSAPEHISAEDLGRAVGYLATYAVPMATRAFREAALPEAERDARVLARWYLKLPMPRPSVLNARELRRMARGPGIPTPDRIRAALEELAAFDWVRPAPTREGDSKGRRRTDWTVNPAMRDAKR
jgi:hypothetical protein